MSKIKKVFGGGGSRTKGGSRIAEENAMLSLDDGLDSVSATMEGLGKISRLSSSEDAFLRLSSGSGSSPAILRKEKEHIIPQSAPIPRRQRKKVSEGRATLEKEVAPEVRINPETGSQSLYPPPSKLERQRSETLLTVLEKAKPWGQRLGDLLDKLYPLFM